MDFERNAAVSVLSHPFSDRFCHGGLSLEIMKLHEPIGSSLPQDPPGTVQGAQFSTLDIHFHEVGNLIRKKIIQGDRLHGNLLPMDFGADRLWEMRKIMAVESSTHAGVGRLKGDGTRTVRRGGMNDANRIPSAGRPVSGITLEFLGPEGIRLHGDDGSALHEFIGRFGELAQAGADVRENPNLLQHSSESAQNVGLVRISGEVGPVKR